MIQSCLTLRVYHNQKIETKKVEKTKHMNYDNNFK